MTNLLVHLPDAAQSGASALPWLALLTVAVVGTVSSTVYLVLALVAAARNLRPAQAALSAVAAVASSELPPVTIFKPLHGAEPRLEQNLESFFLQDYPAFEIVFGCRNASDASLAVVERLRARHPRIAARVVLSGEPPWPSAKVWSLSHMIATSTSQYLVISDSDILVRPDFLRNVIPPLLDPATGLVTCLYAGIPASAPAAQNLECHPDPEQREGEGPLPRANIEHSSKLSGRQSTLAESPAALPNPTPATPHIGLVPCPARDFWSTLEALGMSVEFSSGVLIAEMLEGMRFALGSAMALRRDALEKIGGIGCAADYYADDFILGNRVFAAGYRVLLSPYRVGHVLCTQSFRQTFATQLRWMQSTRFSRPRGHLGSGLTFAVPFGLLGLAAAAALGHPCLGLGLLAASLVNRIVQSAAVGYAVIGDRRALTLCWLYPLRDLLGFAVWLASYCLGPTFRWRGELYRFTPGGRIESIQRANQAAGSNVHD